MAICAARKFDVFLVEPIRPDNPLLGLDRVALTPHLAALSADGFAIGIQRMVANFQAILSGQDPRPEDILV